jgi:hypothetical protein
MPGMCLAMVAVAAMLVVRVGEHEGNGRGGNNGGSRRGINKAGSGCAVYWQWEWRWQ